MHILNKLILTPVNIPFAEQLTGGYAIELLRIQGYTHIFIDDEGYIDAVSPLGEVIHRYRLFKQSRTKGPIPC